MLVEFKASKFQELTFPQIPLNNKKLWYPKLKMCQWVATHRNFVIMMCMRAAHV